MMAQHEKETTKEKPKVRYTHRCSQKKVIKSLVDTNIAQNVLIVNSAAKVRKELIDSAEKVRKELIDSAEKVRKELKDTLKSNSDVINSICTDLSKNTADTKSLKETVNGNGKLGMKVDLELVKQSVTNIESNVDAIMTRFQDTESDVDIAKHALELYKIENVTAERVKKELEKSLVENKAISDRVSQLRLQKLGFIIGTILAVITITIALFKIFSDKVVIKNLKSADVIEISDSTSYEQSLVKDKLNNRGSHYSLFVGDTLKK